MMTIFVNSLFFTLSLLFISLFTLIFLFGQNCLSILMFLLIMTIYVGAMMIFIGYICAICPNLKLVNPNSRFFFIIAFIVIFYFSCSSVSVTRVSSKSPTLLDYLFRNWGFNLFIVIALMLFLVLLIVTSQYSSPQGPFRSIS